MLARYQTEPANPLQHLIEHVPAHHHLSKLEHKPPGMTHQTPTYLDEPRLNTGQRPVFYSFRQSQPDSGFQRASIKPATTRIQRAAFVGIYVAEVRSDSCTLTNSPVRSNSI